MLIISFVVVIIIVNHDYLHIVNSRLSYQFLDLREGAKIIALKPFGDNKLNERTVSGLKPISSL